MRRITVNAASIIGNAARLVSETASIPHAMGIISRMSPYQRIALFDDVAKRFYTVKLGDSEKLSRTCFAQGLECKIKSLWSDGLHTDGLRQKIVRRYYDAYLKAEEGLEGVYDGENAVYEYEGGKVKFFVVKSEEEKAKGIAIIAKDGTDIVGRLFIAQTPSHDHLTILYHNPRAKVKSDVITSKLLETFFDYQYGKDRKESDLTREVHRSCVGRYAPHLRVMSEAVGKENSLFEKTRFLCPRFSLINLHQVVMEFVKTKCKSSDVSRPNSTTTSPSASKVGVVIKEPELER